MQPDLFTGSHPDARAQRRPSIAAACPVCRGTLVPQRGMFRCSRCGYAFCDGCEGADNPRDETNDL